MTRKGIPSLASRLAATCLTAFVALWGSPLAAEEGEDAIVARVNGTVIRASDMQLAYNDLVGQLRDVAPRLRYAYIADYLIERRLLASAGQKKALDADEDYLRRIRFYRSKALRDAYFEAVIRPSVSEEAARELYDERVGDIESEPTAKASHILVASKEEAEDVLKRLEDGEEFASLARMRSLDPASATAGGALGEFAAAEMATPFAATAFALKPGEIGGPVRTKFGWHVIRLEALGERAPPAFDEAREEIMTILLQEAARKEIERLRADADIEILDEGLVAMREALKARRDAENGKDGKDARDDETR